MSYGAGTMLALLSIVAISNPSTQEKSEAREIRSLMQKALSLQGAAFPWYAEYELNMEPHPPFEGGTISRIKRNFSSSRPGSYWVVTNTDNWKTLLLIEDGSLYWEYYDSTHGTFRFKGRCYSGLEIAGPMAIGEGVRGSIPHETGCGTTQGSCGSGGCVPRNTPRGGGP